MKNKEENSSEDLREYVGHLYDNLFRITEFTWRRSVSNQAERSRKDQSLTSKILQDLKRPEAARLPELITENIEKIIARLDIAQVAVKLAGNNQVLVFSNKYNDRIVKAEKSGKQCYHFRTDKDSAEVINPFNVQSLKNYNIRVAATDAKLVSGLMEYDNSECLVLVSKEVTPFHARKPANENCYIFFSIPSAEIDNLRNALDFNTETAEYKTSKLLDYRIAANLITCVLAPSIKEFTRYSRYPFLDMLSDCISDYYKTIDPPWHRGSALPTITLVLDIRKSTFSMTYALTQSGFAHWMEIVIQSLRTVADKYGAIFDKFTGDGVMVHFASLKKSDEYVDLMTSLAQAEYRQIVDEIASRLGDDYIFPNGAESETLYGNELRLVLAYCCGWEMIQTMNYHTQRLEDLLTKGHPELGATVGIGMGRATWSLDRDENPIVVGPGVVGACRAVDSGKTGKMITMPAVISRLRKMGLLQESPEIVPVKKSDIDVDEQYYALSRPSDFLPFSVCNIHDGLQSYYEKWDIPAQDC